jgi:hypothetical protein
MSRQPLVYATTSALEQAKGILPSGVVLENAVTREIVAGHIRFANGHGSVSGRGWQASVCRCEPRNRIRKHPRPWLIVEVRANPSEGGVGDGNDEADRRAFGSGPKDRAQEGQPDDRRD